MSKKYEDASLLDWFKTEPSVTKVSLHSNEKEIELQFNGFSVTLISDGTFILTDTGGG